MLYWTPYTLKAWIKQFLNIFHQTFKKKKRKKKSYWFGRTWGRVKHFWVKYPFKFMLLQGFSLCKFTVPFICPTIHNSLKPKVRFHTNIAYFSILSCGLRCCHGTWWRLGEGLLTIAVSHWNRENVDHWLQGTKAVQSSERSDSNRGRGALDGGRSNATRTETFPALAV